MENTKSLDNNIDVYSLTRKKGGLKINSDRINIDDAIILTLIEGLTHICDQRRYSLDRLKRYTRKWNIRPYEG